MSGQPDSSSLLVNVSYPVAPYQLTPLDSLYSLKNWIETPVIRATRVLVIKDEAVKTYYITSKVLPKLIVTTGTKMNSISTNDSFTFDKSMYDRVTFSLKASAISLHSTFNPTEDVKDRLNLAIKDQDNYTATVYATAPMPLAALNPGQYSINITATGYKQGLRDPIPSQTGFKLTVKQAADSIVWNNLNINQAYDQSFDIVLEDHVTTAEGYQPDYIVNTTQPHPLWISSSITTDNRGLHHLIGHPTYSNIGGNQKVTVDARVAGINLASGTFTINLTADNNLRAGWKSDNLPEAVRGVVYPDIDLNNWIQTTDRSDHPVEDHYRYQLQSNTCSQWLIQKSGKENILTTVANDKTVPNTAIDCDIELQAISAASGQSPNIRKHLVVRDPTSLWNQTAMSITQPYTQNFKIILENYTTDAVSQYEIVNTPPAWINPTIQYDSINNYHFITGQPTYADLTQEGPLTLTVKAVSAQKTENGNFLIHLEADNKLNVHWKNNSFPIATKGMSYANVILDDYIETKNADGVAIEDHYTYTVENGCSQWLSWDASHDYLLTANNQSVPVNTHDCVIGLTATSRSSGKSVSINKNITVKDPVPEWISAEDNISIPFDTVSKDDKNPIRLNEYLRPQNTPTDHLILKFDEALRNEAPYKYWDIYSPDNGQNWYLVRKPNAQGQLYVDDIGSTVVNRLTIKAKYANNYYNDESSHVMNLTVLSDPEIKFKWKNDPACELKVSAEYPSGQTLAVDLLNCFNYVKRNGTIINVTGDYVNFPNFNKGNYPNAIRIDSNSDGNPLLKIDSPTTAASLGKSYPLIVNVTSKSTGYDPIAMTETNGNSRNIHVNESLTVKATLENTRVIESPLRTYSIIDINDLQDSSYILTYNVISHDPNLSTNKPFICQERLLDNLSNYDKCHLYAESAVPLNNASILWISNKNYGKTDINSVTLQKR